MTLLWLLTRVSLFQQVSFEWCYGVYSPSFLSSQTPAGRGGWPPFVSLVLPEVSARLWSRSFPQSPQARSGQEIRLKTFRCNLLVSLARILFLNWLYMNELDYLEINSLDFIGL